MPLKQRVTMDRDAVFWDRIAERYSRDPVADEAAYQKKLEVTRGYLRPDMEVLEIGCGTGSTAILHAPHVTHIQAIDISSKMIEIARRKVDADNIENLTFQQSTVDGFSAPDGCYNAVLALSVLHLLEDRNAAIAKVHRLLKPGGIFVSSTVCLGDSMLRFLKPIASIGKLFGLLPLVKAFTPQELADSITDAGFEIDHQWQPGKGKAVFIVARKAA